MLDKRLLMAIDDDVGNKSSSEHFLTTSKKGLKV